MTNMQLYLAAGMPAFLILSNTGVMFFLFGHLNSQVNVRFDKQDARLDRIDARLDRNDSRLDRIEADLRQFYSVNAH